MDTQNTGSAHKGQHINSYTIAFKLKVVDFAKANNNSLASKTFCVDRKRVIEWRKNEQSLKCMDNKTLKKKKKGSGRKLVYPDIDTTLLGWIQKRRNAGARVTGKALKAEAMRLHRLNGNQQFKASCGWLRKFRRRHNLKFRKSTHVGQKSEEVLGDKMQHFLGFVTRLRRRRNYSLSLIGNMDETPMWVDMPGNYTLETVGTKTVSMKSTGHEKSRITIMLAAMADGTKLTPMVLFQGVRPPKIIPPGIIVEMAPKSWANETIICTWLQRVWRKNSSQRRLLVWDAFNGHITPKVKKVLSENFNTDMAVIPGGCTSKLQPCDVSWNRPMKDSFRDSYDDWLVDGPQELTRGGNRKPPSRELLMAWIKKAWNGISPDLIRKSFKKTGLSLAVDGTEDDLLFMESSDDEDPFAGFTAGEIEATAQLSENIDDEVRMLDGDEYSEGSDEDEVEDEDNVYDDPGSPGH